jgi:hypothetical protein
MENHSAWSAEFSDAVYHESAFGNHEQQPGYLRRRYCHLLVGHNQQYSEPYCAAVFGLNQGAQPIIGYNIGAKNYSRVKKTLACTLLTATFFSFPRLGCHKAVSRSAFCLLQ